MYNTCNGFIIILIFSILTLLSLQVYLYSCCFSKQYFKAIVQHPLNESEQQQFLKQLKIEEKSKVKFEEFLPVLIKYLHDGGFSSEGANKRRKLMDSAVFIL